MATNTEAEALGFILPDGQDLISGGDNAISRNARASTDVAFARTRIGATGPADAFNLDPGSYVVHSLSAAANVANLPEQWPGTLLVPGVIGQPVRFMIFAPYQKSYLWVTAANDLSGGFMPWWKVSSSSSDAATPNSIHLARMFAHYGGPVDTAGLGAVSWRIDHGWANFKTKLLPIFRAAGIVPLVTYNPRDWSRSENAGVTLTEVNDWVANGWIEISNHGATHADATGDDAIRDYVAGSLAEIETQLPAAKGQVWGFHLAGVGNSEAFDGFGSGSTAAQWDTTMGREILRSHAFGSGYVPDTAQRVIDGNVRNGLLHMATDVRPVAEMKAQIDQAIADRTGFQIMTHPSLVDTAGNNTTAMIQELVDYIVAKRDAGQIAVLSPYQMMLADSTNPPTDLAALTSRLDALTGRLALMEFDSDWIDVTSRMSVAPVSGSLFIRREGRRVWIQASALKFAASASFVTLTDLLPSGYRPTKITDLAMGRRSSNTPGGAFRANSNGTSYFYYVSGGEQIDGIGDFFTADPIPTI